MRIAIGWKRRKKAISSNENGGREHENGTVADTRESQQGGTEGGNDKNALKRGDENIRKERRERLKKEQRKRAVVRRHSHGHSSS